LRKTVKERQTISPHKTLRRRKKDARKLKKNTVKRKSERLRLKSVQTPGVKRVDRACWGGNGKGEETERESKRGIGNGKQTVNEYRIPKLVKERSRRKQSKKTCPGKKTRGAGEQRKGWLN